MSLILSLIAFLIMSNQFEQTLSRSITQSVTLWLFGDHRLDSGQSTLPLQPQGTAINGLSTTYLYEVANPVTTIVDVNGSPEFSVSVQIATRTIVASASGWVEHFGTTDTIQCNFFSSGSASGICFDRTQTNSGTPTPVVLAVSTSAPVPAFTTSFPTQTLPTPNSATSPMDSDPTTTPTPSHNLSAGAIAGVIIGVTLAVFVLVVLVLLLFRRRQRRLAEGNERAKGTTIETYEPFSYPQTIANAQGRPYPFPSSTGSTANGMISP